MIPLDFGVFDSDNHYYEPRDAFRHVPPELADRAVRIVTDDSGKDTILVGGKKHHFTPPTFDLVPPPGHLKEMLKGHGEGTAASFLKPMRPEYQNRDARLAVMDDDTLVGVISERDIVVHIAQGANLDHVTAAEVMATELVTVEPTATVVEAARLMIESGVRHQPVLAEENDDLVGFLSVRAVVEALAARD